ncbi:hypothetical protein Tco_0406323 [Tanacetum coccineum]
MNYKPIVIGNQSNGSTSKTRVETISGKDYILLQLWTQDPPFSSSSKVLSTEEPRKDQRDDQEKEDDVNSTNTVNAASTNEVNVVGAKTSIELPDDPNMPTL